MISINYFPIQWALYVDKQAITQCYAVGFLLRKQYISYDSLKLFKVHTLILAKLRDGRELLFVPESYEMVFHLVLISYMCEVFIDKFINEFLLASKL